MGMKNGIERMVTVVLTLISDMIIYALIITVFLLWGYESGYEWFQVFGTFDMPKIIASLLLIGFFALLAEKQWRRCI